MNPDTLFFRFDKHGQKRIKVKPVVQVNLKKQYQISGEITNTPDSVLVNGPQSVLDTLQFVYTEKQQFNMADKSILAAMKINPVKELYFEPQMVDVNIPVEEFTEAQQLVSVVLAEKPANLKIKLFPARVKVSFQVGLSHFAEIHPEDFKLTVMYSDIQKGKPRLKISANSTPEYLYDLKITPEELEYLIEN
jgi:YbbR domain-containing protein